jgi:futalosine hydrolase
VTLLVATAVDAERDAILAAVDSARVEVIVAGVGPAGAAAATSARLARGDVRAVLCAGVGGGFAPLTPGDVAVAATIAFADLGADSASGFLGVADLGFDGGEYPVSPQRAVELADATGGHLGTVLTVATVTGTAQRAEQLLRRYPDAVAEAMEGAGVAAAAHLHGVPFAEIRAISNTVGPRDRAAWEIPRALQALGAAVAASAAVLAASLPTT